MIKMPVTDDEIEEAVEAFEGLSKKIEEEHGGAEGLSDDFKQIYEGEVPDPDSVKEVLNEIQHVIEREQDKYRKLMNSVGFVTNVFENDEIIVIQDSNDEIERIIDNYGVPEDYRYNMRRVVQQAYRYAELRVRDREGYKFYFVVIVFRKPNKDE
jgi:hypothetical protein